MEFKRKIKISKFLSYVLRHNPGSIGITLSDDGWAEVKKILSNTPMTLQELKEIVNTDDKGRYEFNLNKTQIRALQGHSTPVKIKFEEITPDFVFHGTARHNLQSIWKNGINSGKRAYAHFSFDVVTALSVAKRHSTEVVILYIDTKKMTEDGYKIYKSKNNVALIKFAPPKYITEYDRS